MIKSLHLITLLSFSEIPFMKVLRGYLVRGNNFHDSIQNLPSFLLHRKVGIKIQLGFSLFSVRK
jgi:hypothetical protein